MTQHPAFRTSLFLLCLSVASNAHAQTQAPAKPFEPQVGQAGRTSCGCLRLRGSSTRCWTWRS